MTGIDGKPAICVVCKETIRPEHRDWRKCDNPAVQTSDGKYYHFECGQYYDRVYRTALTYAKTTNCISVETTRYGKKSEVLSARVFRGLSREDAVKRIANAEKNATKEYYTRVSDITIKFGPDAEYPNLVVHVPSFMLTKNKVWEG